MGDALNTPTVVREVGKLMVMSQRAAVLWWRRWIGFRHSKQQDPGT
jgi:hypothetical protein